MVSPETISNLLADSPLPWEMLCLPEIESTNAELSRRFGSARTIPRMILWSDCQTAGQGRLTRTWLSVPGRDITASVCFPSPVSAADAPKLSIVAGLALVRVLADLYNMSTQLRWPNDVLTPRGKIAGILSSYLSSCEGIVCGIGINVNSDPDDFELEPGRPRTTIRAEIGHDISREELFCEWLKAFEEMWPLAMPEKIDQLRATFDPVDFYRNKRVLVLVGAGNDRDTPGDCEKFEGTTSGLDTSGALVVIDHQGHRHPMSVEDVLVPLE
jgi:BirA family biotin operon repressor/biotin-[acetyl-CoA-carboxylase] ligase